MTNTKLEQLKKTFIYDEENERTLISESTPQEIKDLLFEHGFEIKDFDYNVASNAMDELTDYLEDNNITDPKKLDEAYDVFDNIQASPYTHNLTKWLSESTYNVEYLTEALTEYDPQDGYQLLALAQERAMYEVYDTVRQTIIDYLTK